MIAIDVSSAAGKPPFGGIDGSIRSLVPELLRLDPNTRYVLCHDFSRWRKHGAYDPGAPNARVRVIQDPLNALLIRGTRLFHSLHTFLPRTPRVVKLGTVWDLNAVRNPQWCTPHWHEKRSRRISDVVSRSDVILTTSRFMAEELIDEYGLDASRVRTLPLAVDTKAFAAVSSDTAAKVRAEYGDYLISIGLLTHRKNFPRLIEAMAPLGALRLVLVGRGSDAETEVEAAIDRFGMRERVTRLAGVDHARLVELIGSAHACAVPSLYEGFGLTPLEAMACGTPVVCSNAASLPEAAGDGAVLVDASDPEALGDAIRRVVEDVAFAAQLRERGLARARASTWESSAARLLELYRELGAT